MHKTTTLPFFNIIDFGAIPDGLSICTEAFISAIQACTAAGGGTVYIPGGSFLTGPIHLKSNITLHLDSGARVLFSQNPVDYSIIDSQWEGEGCQVYSPQIYGAGEENIAITGQGILNGQGDFWWQLHRQKQLKFPRPRLISFEDCNNVSIEGITLINSPSWTIHPLRCENVTMTHVTINNPADSPNTDGINPESCKNVHIANCHIDVGDDCIALKSGKEDCSNKSACENVTITNCTMVHGHGAVVIGSEMSGGIRNIVISNCVFEGTDRGIRLKSRRGRGGFIEDIRINNIVMRDVICPFVIHLYYHCGPGGKEKFVSDKNPYPVSEATPIFQRIHFSNITAGEVSAAAGFIYGLPEMPVQDVTFDNILVTMAQKATPGLPAMMCHLEPMKQSGFFCCNAKNISFENVRICGNKGPVFQMDNVKDIRLTRCSTGESVSDEPVILLERVQRAFIQGCNITNDQQMFIELKGMANQDVELVGNSGRIGVKQIKLSDGAEKSAIILRHEACLMPNPILKELLEQ